MFSTGDTDTWHILSLYC